MATDLRQLPKTPTGIVGFDQITGGGVPTGRPTLLCGAAGCGKTLFAMTFLVCGAQKNDEPGVFMSFEEHAGDLSANVASLGYDLDGLIAENRLVIDHVQLDRSQIEETGDYDLEGLFVRLDYAITRIGAKRVVLDTIETLFSSFTDAGMLRAELRRLFEWLKKRGVTAIITGERGEGQLTRYGIEEYISDCVVLLDNRVVDQVTTRRLRVVKYRGSAHGTNEYPFLIDAQGISVFPVTSAGLDHQTSDRVVSSGVSQLDEMFDLRGYFRASSILISGLAGTGKTTFAASFIDACCRAGEKCLYFVFEESPKQIVRNMESIGIRLGQHLASGLLQFEAARPSVYGVEMHLAKMHRDISVFNPSIVLIDPITAFRGPATEVNSILLRLIDLLKSHGITALFTSLSSIDETMNESDHAISSLMDAWVSLSNTTSNGERNRILYVLKARGMGHSNQLREYQITSQGIKVVPAYIGAAGVLTGSARVTQEASEREDLAAAKQEAELRVRVLARSRQVVERQIEDMRAGLDDADKEALGLTTQRILQQSVVASDRSVMAKRRS
ncbi:circadian clock protein KaiC [Ramlibacter sp.]|uniref:circadian clock protein KaiC n=1 Tax=Ramlibacter sp. TaxID=1917967 RepID=UPI00262F151E|nr:circadian clock protein KaiC [Ramlibacter sp.]MDB5953747.1 putative circadian clock protein KaiC [Ramlibacter sp.]